MSLVMGCVVWILLGLIILWVARSRTYKANPPDGMAEAVFLITWPFWLVAILFA